MGSRKVGKWESGKVRELESWRVSERRKVRESESN
jgi:hypothetical protein